MSEKSPNLTPLNGECRQPEACSLDEARAGTFVRIKQLNATPEVSRQLREMGFCEEQRIKLLLKHTNVICQVCNARLGISNKLAQSIIVEPIPAERKRAA